MVIFVANDFPEKMVSNKRKFASWVLLSVFLPMLFLASTHVHTFDAGDGDSVACDHHACGGHLGRTGESMHDCVLCQFLTLPFLAVAVAAVILVNHDVSQTLLSQIRNGFSAEICGIVGLRAPPFVSLVA